MKLAEIQKNGQKMPRNRQKQIKIVKKWTKQAGAKLGQAQLKLGLNFNSINMNKKNLIVLVE